MKLICLILAFVSMTGCLGSDLPKPKSDVPVTSDIGWWAYQDELRVDEITASVIEAPLNLFNNRALVAFRLKGVVRYSKGGWRPYVGEAQISERFKNETGNLTGDILITPIVAVKEDSSYKGESIPFDFKIEQIIRTFRWGKNTYTVQSQDRQIILELHQRK